MIGIIGGRESSPKLAVLIFTTRKQVALTVMVGMALNRGEKVQTAGHAEVRWAETIQLRFSAAGPPCP